MLDLINEILQTLKCNKLRTALTGFAVSWGIFLLIVLLSVSQGLMNGMEHMFSQRDRETMVITGGWAHKPWEGLSEDRRIELRDRDAAVIQGKNGTVVQNVATVLRTESVRISTQKDYITDGYVGVYPEAARVDGVDITEGRFINRNDINQSRRVIVLSKKNVDILFGQENAIGRQVCVGDLSFTVIGIYDHEWNKQTYIPYSTARGLSGGTDKVDRITVKIKNISTEQQSMAADTAFRRTLGRQHKFDPTDESAVWINNRFAEYVRTSSASGAISIAVWIIGILTLLSGIVGVSNIMFVSVRERTHEIGVKRAIGARPAAILRQIILESVAITTLFGYIGIVFGVIVAKVVSGMLEGPHSPIRNATVDITIALEVTAVLIVAGALAGLFPALKSLKIKPVEALRDE